MGRDGRPWIAIDTAIPSLRWIADELAAREWTLKLIVSTHGHWDHTGNNAAVASETGASIQYRSNASNSGMTRLAVRASKR